jgi:hypothetical protein
MYSSFVQDVQDMSSSFEKLLCLPFREMRRFAVLRMACVGLEKPIAFLESPRTKAMMMN